jgi:hypothetical protein
MSEAIDVFASLVGTWSGTNRLYLEPGNLAGESATSGTVRLVLGGKVAVHEYEWSFEGETHSGVALLAANDDGYQVSWADSFHTASAIMSFGPVAGEEGLVVHGTYPAPEGPDWGWTIKWSKPSESELLVEMWNIPPGADPGLAVEMTFSAS